MEKRQPSQQMILEQMDVYMQKNKLDTYFTPYATIISKWTTDLNVKHKTIKLLEENIRENLSNLGFGDQFLHTILKAPPVKEKKINKLNFIKIKTFPL